VSLRQEQNQGKQAAVRRGLRQLRRYPLDAVALIDGDGQHDPRELPPLARLLERHQGVIGARSRQQMPAHRRLSNWLVNAGFRWIGGVDFVDVQSGLRLYRKPLCDLLARELPREGGYGLEHESLAIIARHARRQGTTVRLAAAPASCAYGQAQSSMGPGHILQLALETVRQAARIRRAVQQPLGAGAGAVL
jgi:glycosyltransferase involved in cell wall biosynthesis